MHRKVLYLLAIAAIMNGPVGAKDESSELPPLLFDGATRVVAYFLESPRKEDRYLDRDGVERAVGGRLLASHPKDRSEIIYKKNLKIFARSEAPVAHSQIANLRKALTEKKGSRAVMACYDPHHAMVFYDSEGEPVGCVEVCFSCNQVKVKPDFRDLDPRVDFMYDRSDFLAIGKIFRHAGIPLEPYTSISALKKGDKYWRDRCSAEIAKKLGEEDRSKKQGVKSLAD
ncbi:hypothetical protein [Luteolibacter marinus]|uniref:hypothetical protein n=1 Tax=Luteolibacter marinus TaxID=2776705 RepID=UPI001867D73F|nr:hypothetical protein [Luteolibacter marinus]